MKLGKDPVLYASRKLIKIDGKSNESNLAISKIVSYSLVTVVKSLSMKPFTVITKGGITSSDIATQGLEIKKVRILGQIINGVPNLISLQVISGEEGLKDIPILLGILHH